MTPATMGKAVHVFDGPDGTKRVNQLREELIKALKVLNNMDESFASPENGNTDCKGNEVSDGMEMLRQELLDLQRENEILRQSLELSTTNNQRLKLEIDDLQVAPAVLISDGDVHQACRDKITALRSVARALESENELLSNEQASRKDFGGQNEVRTLNERLGRLQSEKINVMTQLVSFEQDLEAATNLKNELESRLVDSQAANEAMRHGKRVVEAEMQNVAMENENLLRDMEILKAEKDEAVQQLLLTQNILSEKNRGTNVLEQELALQLSIYESNIATMHAELDARLDEITLSSKNEAESVKAKYVSLFDEKAEEFHNLRVESEATKQLLADHRYRENEMKEQMEKQQKCHDEKLSVSIRNLHSELERFKSEESVKLRKELQMIRSQFDNLQLSYLNAIARFKSATEKEAEVAAASDRDSGAKISTLEDAQEPPISDTATKDCLPGARAAKTAPPPPGRRKKWQKRKRRP